MIKTLLFTTLVAIAAIASAPAMAAPGIVENAGGAAITSPALSDPLLAEIRGGQAQNEIAFARNAHAIILNQFDATTRSLNGIAGEIVDTWWASTGLELISANIFANR